MTALLPTTATHQSKDLPTVIRTFLFSADDESIWLALPYETLLRAAEQFEREGSPEGTGVMIDPTTKLPYHGTEETLYEEYRLYCEATGLEWVDAMEHVYNDALTTEQRQWISAFIIRWDAVMKQQDAERRAKVTFD